MKTLLLRLAAPLQSWGSYSKFDTRVTNREPTKSGVIGLLAAALGRRRQDNLDDLRVLKFAVRLDQSNKRFIDDYHTARHPGITKRLFISHRHYLIDSVFVVGLEGDGVLIDKLAAALQAPVFPLALGRRSCPPTPPLVLGVKDKPLLVALREEPWWASEWYRRSQAEEVSLEIVRDANHDEQFAYLQHDQPKTFAPSYRQYDWRFVIADEEKVKLKNPDSRQKTITTHDPFLDLETDENLEKN